MTARYTLHGIWASGPTYKVGLMLSLAGETYDYIHVDLRQGEHKQPGYLAKNRFGQVPCLVDTSNGRQLCQSASILEFLADKTGKFGGATLDERFAAREWMFWDFDRLAPAIYRVRAAKLGFRKAHEAVVESYTGDGQVALKTLDDHLAGRLWIVGEGTTIADIDIYGVVGYATQGGYDLSQYPSIRSWMARIEALPGYAGPETLLPKESKAA